MVVDWFLSDDEKTIKVVKIRALDGYVFIELSEENIIDMLHALRNPSDDFKQNVKA